MFSKPVELLFIDGPAVGADDELNLFAPVLGLLPTVGDAVPNQVPFNERLTTKN